MHLKMSSAKWGPFCWGVNVLNNHLCGTSTGSSFLYPVCIPDLVCGLIIILRFFCKTISTLRPRQNRQNFPDDFFQSIFLSENVWILIKISLKFFHNVWINSILSLVQIMAWHWLSVKPLSELMMVSLLRHMSLGDSASNELTNGSQDKISSIPKTTFIVLY